MAKQIQTFATNSAGGAPRKIQAGLFVFSGDQRAARPSSSGRSMRRRLRICAEHFPNPSGNTPLGNALERRQPKAVLRFAPAAQTRAGHHRWHEHIGAGAGRGDAEAQAAGRAKSRRALSVHFVAFDVDAKVFDPVKKLGATVVGAADEKQLNTQLEFILQKKILLEEEEPPKKK